MGIYGQIIMAHGGFRAESSPIRRGCLLEVAPHTPHAD